MRIDKGKVRVPEIGRLWLNSPPLATRQLRGNIILFDFWDYTCVNCLRTLPYVQAWHEKYKHAGLVVIGIHSPEFTFAQYESNVERAVREFGLTYPIVLDSNHELFQLFANRYWPAKYLADKDGYLRYVHFGEGGYAETETVIQQLLLEANPSLHLPPLTAPVRPEDTDGAVCYRPTPEVYTGYRRGHLANEGGFSQEQRADYQFTGEPEEGSLYARGRWNSTAEYFEAAGEGADTIVLRHSAAAVNLVLAVHNRAAGEVVVRQDGKPLSRTVATSDTTFRPARNSEESLVVVDRPRMYALVDNHAFGTHTLELTFSPGVAAFAFTFTSCVDPLQSALPA